MPFLLVLSAERKRLPLTYLDGDYIQPIERFRRNLMTFVAIKTLEAIRLEINSYYCVFLACATTLRYLSGWLRKFLSHLLLMLHVINFLKSLSRGKVFSSECVRTEEQEEER